MSNESQLATTKASSVKEFLALPAYRDRFNEVMGKRAPQFMAAITAVSQMPALKEAEPRSVIAAAMVAATLDLAVNPTLGQAHIVAYSDGQGQKVAQFQIGYKGLIQLALRSGQYKRLNAGPVSGSVFKGYDMMGEPILDWSAFNDAAPVTGYFCAFETLNGFQKVVYWSKEQAEAHGKRFSRAYAKGYATPWKSDFDSMAAKSVIKAALSKWGILSVEMQKAVVHDQGAQEDVDAEVKFVDGAEETAPQSEDSVPGDPAPTATTRPRTAARKGVNAVKNVTPEKVVEADVAKPSEKPADVAQMPTAEPQKHEEAQPEEEPAPVPPAQEQAAPRVFLKDGEKVTVEVEVTEIALGGSKQGDKTVPTVQATVKGGFNGSIRHLGGAVEESPGVMKESAPWAVGARVRVELLGALSKATSGPNVGKVLAWVQKVEAVS